MPSSPTVRFRPPLNVGISGTGFLGRGLYDLVKQAGDLRLAKVLTRRPAGAVTGFEESDLTRSSTEFIDQSDIVVECSGDVYHAAEVVWAAHLAGRPVVTMNSEFHVTVGSHFVESGYLTEAEGDQPGSLAALREEVISMGFEPVIFGNIKGFLNHHPTREDMEFWAGRNGISLTQVTSFTDGTKLQVEQALVANGLGAGILQRGLVGPSGVTLEEAAGSLGPRAQATGRAISDYVLNAKLPAGVFVTAVHPASRPEVLRYLKLGDGPFYTLLRPYHLCQFELMRTLRRAADGGRPLLHNSRVPEIAVVAVAKADLEPGSLIQHGMGGFEVRGEAARFRDEPGAVPAGLLSGARILRRVAKGQIVGWSDVEVPEGRARDAALTIRDRVLGTRKVGESLIGSAA